MRYGPFSRTVRLAYFPVLTIPRPSLASCRCTRARARQDAGGHSPGGMAWVRRPVVCSLKSPQLLGEPATLLQVETAELEVRVGVDEQRCRLVAFWLC